jgi:hypothetical protein
LEDWVHKHKAFKSSTIPPSSRRSFVAKEHFSFFTSIYEMAPTFVFQYYDGQSSIITITTNTSQPVITGTDTAAATTATSTLSAAELFETVEYSTTTVFNSQSDPTEVVKPTATLTSLGLYTIPLTLVLLPGITPAVPTTTTPITSTTQPAAATTSSPSSSSSVSASASSSSASKSASSSTGTPTPKSYSGEIAGAAVGCLIGGALIAGLVVWLFMSSRHKRHRSRGGFVKDRKSPSNANREKSLPTAPLLAGAAAGAGAGWEQHLPQSESDGTIRTSVKALFDQIELHVENFYRNAAVSISSGIQAELMKVDSSYLPDSVAGLLPQTKTPTMLIKHCLAHLIVSRITPDSDTSVSFLPADFVALPHAMSGTRANSDKPGKRSECRPWISGQTNDIAAFAQALSRWRVLSYYLRPRAKDDRAYLSIRDGNITNAADIFCSAFTPWATSLNDLEARRRNLIEIMKSAADTGIMIFSQPSSFTYRWAVPSERDRRGLNRIVVVPGFAKVSDEHARDLPGRGQELVAPVIATL